MFSIPTASKLITNKSITCGVSNDFTIGFIMAEIILLSQFEFAIAIEPSLAFTELSSEGMEAIS